MKLFNTYKKEFALGIGIVALFLFLRLFNLLLLPIFTDEAIYLRWAQIALNDSNWRFISLTDGKQPLFTWFMMISMNFISDPLLAGRLVSVIMGFFTMIGLFLVSFELFKNKRVALLSAFLFVFLPIAVVHDRMAMQDSTVATFAIWSLYISILLVRRIRLDIAYTLGFVIGGAVLTKTNGFFSAGLLPFTLFLFDFKKEHLKNRLLRWIVYIIVAVVISQLMYSILRLSPLYGVISTKNATFVYPVNEWIKHPFTYFTQNIKSLALWLYEYLSISYITLFVVGLLYIRTFLREKLLLLVYFAAPVIYLAFFGVSLFPRFIYFSMIMLLPICSWTLDFIFQKVERKFDSKKDSAVRISTITIILFLTISYQAFASYKVIFDPINAPIAASDNSQYVNNWTAGWGTTHAIQYLKKEAETQKVFVGTMGTFGLMPAALELYLVQNPNITIRGYWPPEDKLPQEVLDSAQVMPTYFVLYQPQTPKIAQYPLDLVFEERAGNSKKDSFRLYRVRAQ